ncbi:2,3-diaminopropionate biosynthesis protein SbnB [Amycolatopsis sp. NPDC005003]
MLILRRRDVDAILTGREAAVLAAVRAAYLTHRAGHTSLPHSVFLRFPGSPRDRIISLPGYLGGERPVAGMKWVASFPGNLADGLDRASAVIVTNSPRTGRPEHLVEASLISARRTGASAALAAATLTGPRPDDGVALIGCGVINFEVLRFLRLVLPGLRAVTLFDLDARRCAEFAARCASEWPRLAVAEAADPATALAAHRLVSFATTAARPHTGLDSCVPGTLVLHVSLRDLTPRSLLTCRNVVDDVDHVCREDTSVHLAEKLSGGRGFLHGTLGEHLDGTRAPARDATAVTVFSPFGLGVLDLAVAALVQEVAEAEGRGLAVPDFLD